MAEPVIVSWSGGKDGCAALRTVRDRGHRVEALLTTFVEGEGRASGQGVRRELIQAQAEALGLSLREVVMPPRPSNAEYERRLAEALIPFRDHGTRSVVFGDLFLEDHREYRSRHLASIGMRALFPVWTTDTTAFVRRFVAAGYRAVVVRADAEKLGADFAGRELDMAFLRDLPAGVDPCGENGEFHTFVFDGPGFAAPVAFGIGETTLEGNAYLTDLLPG